MVDVFTSNVILVANVLSHYVCYVSGFHIRLDVHGFHVYHVCVMHAFSELREADIVMIKLF